MPGHQTFEFRGGAIFISEHLISAWSRVQPRIALSSAEAELYASVRGLAEMVNIVHLMREMLNQPDWGRVILDTDATANRAILLRRGAGGLKHVEVKFLWAKDIVRRYNVLVSRVDRSVMHAHILASPSRASELKAHLEALHAYRA